MNSYTFWKRCDLTRWFFEDCIYDLVPREVCSEQNAADFVLAIYSSADKDHTVLLRDQQLENITARIDEGIGRHCYFLKDFINIKSTIRQKHILREGVRQLKFFCSIELENRSVYWYFSQLYHTF